MQAVAWAATLLGWTGAWVIGNGRRSGWIIATASAALWTAVDYSFGIAAGIVASTIAAAIATRNWLRG